MVYSLSASLAAERAAQDNNRETAGAPEVTVAAARQFKVLQSRAAPAQLSLPLGGITLSAFTRTGVAGKSFRTE